MSMTFKAIHFRYTIYNPILADTKYFTLDKVIKCSPLQHDTLQVCMRSKFLLAKPIPGVCFFCLDYLS